MHIKLTLLMTFPAHLAIPRYSSSVINLPKNIAKTSFKVAYNYEIYNLIFM